MKLLDILCVHAESGKGKTTPTENSTKTGGSTTTGRGRQLTVSPGARGRYIQRLSDNHVARTVRNAQSFGYSNIKISGTGQNRRVTGTKSGASWSSPFAGLAIQPTLRRTSGRYRIK